MNTFYCIAGHSGGYYNQGCETFHENMYDATIFETDGDVSDIFEKDGKTVYGKLTKVQCNSEFAALNRGYVTIDGKHMQLDASGDITDSPLADIELHFGGELCAQPLVEFDDVPTKPASIPHKHVARVAHEANRAWCLANGDTSQLPWDESPQWQVDSAMTGVQYHVDNPNSKPSDSHESWLKEKIDAGWVYGETKDEAKKEHPCCVPYRDLPEYQKVKDRLFVSIVRAMLG